MKTIYNVVSIFLCAWAPVHAQQIITRETRPDALSYSGSMPQLVSRECAQLAQIKQCVCNLNNLLQACCSSLDMQINAVGLILESGLEDIIDILGSISNLDTPISHFETLFSLVESLNISLIETLIEAILGLDSSFDHVSSLIEYDIAIDEVTLAHVSKIETQIETVVSLVDLLVGQNCASANDALASNVDGINSSIDAVLALATQILDMDQTILSKVGKIDTQLDTVNSLIDFAMLDCASHSEVIINEVQLLQEQEASCCQQLFSAVDELHIDIDSRFDAIESGLAGITDVEGLVSQLSALVSAIDNLDTDLIVSLIDTTESGFDVVTSQLDSLSACGSTPISAATTITAPGNYCLDQDIIGSIIIAASDVTLNLNERMISGSVVLTNGTSNIEISNGFVDAGTSSNAIDIFGNISRITLNHLYVRGFYGVLISHPNPATHQIDINHVIAYDCQESGFLLKECYGNVSNSAAYIGHDFGFAIYNSLDNESITVENCEASYNINVGFACTNQLSTDLPNYNIINCTAYSNGARGFSLGANINVYASHCFSSDNGSLNIDAKDGFFISNSGTDQVIGVIADCTSMRNASSGFNLVRLDSSGPRFTGNYATDNGTINGMIANYAIDSTAINTNKPPYYWLPWNNTGAGRRVNISGN